MEFSAEKKRIRPGKSEVFRLWCDNTKISKLTGFKPETDIETGRKKTIEWFSRPENMNKYKAGLYNV